VSDAGDAGTVPEEASSADDGGSVEDAGDGGPTVCNMLVNSGQPVTPNQVAGDAPPFQGGTVVDGTYVLTSESIYTGDGGATGPGGNPQTITIAFQSGTIQVSKDTDPPTSTYMFVPSGTTYTATGECPGLVGSLVGGFTATATTFVASLAGPGGDGGPPTTVETYTKQ
jgi:hypothetical protein